MFQFGGLGALFGGDKPTKSPRGDGTAWLSDNRSYEREYKRYTGRKPGAHWGREDKIRHAKFFL